MLSTFCWWISVLVFSLDSLIVGFRPSCREWMPFCWDPSDLVSEVDLSSMLSVLRWDLSDGELAVARTIWWGSMVGDVRPLFDCFQLLLLLRSIRLCFWGRSLRWTAFCFWRSAIGTDITVCLSQLFGSWVHWWRRVPFWEDASAVEIHQAFVAEVGLGTEAAPFGCDDVVKTENLDWIFLLDVSLLWGWPVDASVLLSTSGNLDLFQI